MGCTTPRILSFLLLDFPADVGDLAVQGRIGLQLLLHGGDVGVNGGMIPVEHDTNGVQGQIRHLADDVHSQISCGLDILGPFYAQNILTAHAVPLGHGGNDLVRGFAHRLRILLEHGNERPHQIHIDLGTVQQVGGGDPLDDTLQLTDVGVELFGDVGEHVVLDHEIHGLCLVFQNGQTELVVRLVDIHDQTLLKAGADPILQGDHFLWRTVGGQNDLLMIAVQRVEGMEKFLLGGFLTSDELDIVDEENIRLAVFFTESGVLPTGDGFDQLIGEILAVDINSVQIGGALKELVGDGVHQMGLTQTGGTVQKQRIVRGCGIVGYRQSRRVGELVGITDDKVVEGVFRIIRQTLFPAAGLILLACRLIHGQEGREIFFLLPFFLHFDLLGAGKRRIHPTLALQGLGRDFFYDKFDGGIAAHDGGGAVGKNPGVALQDIIFFEFILHGEYHGGIVDIDDLHVAEPEIESGGGEFSAFLDGVQDGVPNAAVFRG